MKRLLAIVLTCALLLGCMPALAAEEFTLRNGVKFGDTMDEVRAKETLAFKAYEEGATSLSTEKGVVAGISDVSITYFFDDNNQLEEVRWNLPSRTYVDSSDSDYAALYKAFASKYGTPLGYDNGSCYIITGSALEGAVTIYSLYELLDGIGDMRDYDEWDVTYGDDDHVKIEIAQYYWGTSYSDRKFSINVGYKHFTDADLEAAQQEKREENEAVMNDI